MILGLDARRFNEGQRQAMDAFKKGKEGAVGFGKDVEQAANKMADAFGVVRKGALGFVGAIAGGEVAAFFDHVIKMDAATGRMARSIGTSVQNLSAWQHMVRQVGGEAGAATSALSTLQQEIENVRQGGGMFEGGFASLMNQAGVSIRDDADTSLRKIQAFIAGQISSGRMRPEEAGTFLRRVPGMNQDILNLMLSDFQKIEAAAKSAGTATDQQAAAAQRLQAAGEQVKTTLERLAAGLLVGFVKLADIWNGKSDSAIDDARKRLAEGLNARSSGGGGTTRGDRNNNPGNMEFGAFARAHGATGSDGRFAVFPDWATGAAAQQALISGRGYSGLTLHEFAGRYAEGSPAWERTVGGALGIGPNDVVNNQDPRLADAIRRAEGTGARSSANARAQKAGSSSTTTNDVDIHKIEIHAPNATDADGLSSELGGALKRQSLIAPVNSGLV